MSRGVEIKIMKKSPLTPYASRLTPHFFPFTASAKGGHAPPAPLARFTLYAFSSHLSLLPPKADTHRFCQRQTRTASSAGTLYALRFTLYALRFTLYALRFTLYALRFTLFPLTAHFSLLTPHALLPSNRLDSAWGVHENPLG
jgi:hypothetical protein